MLKIHSDWDGNIKKVLIVKSLYESMADSSDGRVGDCGSKGLQFKPR